MRRLIAIAVLLGAAMPAAAAAPPTPDDYLSVLSAGPWPLEILAYCYATVARDASLQDVGRRWRQRNDGLIATVSRKAAGVVPDDVRRAADAASLAAIRRLVARQYDKPAWCGMMARVIDGGAYDVDRRSDLAPALKRIFGRP